MSTAMAFSDRFTQAPQSSTPAILRLRPAVAAMLSGLVVMAAGCGDDDVSIPADAALEEDAAGDDAGRNEDATVARDTGSTDAFVAEPCPLAGSYHLESISCGAVDVTVDVLARSPEIVLVLSDLPTGGCHLIWQQGSPSCRRTIKAEATPGTTAWTMVSEGVTSCEPEACAFTDGGLPCAVGDQAGTYFEALTVVGDELTATRDDGTSLCADLGGGEQVVVWRGEPG